MPVTSLQKTFDDALHTRISVRMAVSGKITWFLLFSGIFIASFLIHPFHEGPFTVCLVKNILGIPCPGCGMTRAFLFLGHGDIRAALKLNVNSLLVFLIMIVLLLDAAFTVGTGKEVRVHLTKREKVLVYVGIGTATVFGWIYNILLNPLV